MKNEDYFNKENEIAYMSYSQFKDFLECEAKAKAIIDGLYEKPTSTALLQGSYVDAYFSGEMEGFKESHPELFKKDGSLKADYEICEKGIKTIEDDQRSSRNITKGKPSAYSPEPSPAFRSRAKSICFTPTKSSI